MSAMGAIGDITRHLDIGCGSTPRNPYQRTEAHGVDIAPASANRKVNFSVWRI
ncbi:MAG: hypothetical protein IPO38_08895 [Rhodocyclaceae bacterium]|nr:hypothetical protein [Rhodocyclaceae bacterium]